MMTETMKRIITHISHVFIVVLVINIMVSSQISSTQATSPMTPVLQPQGAIAQPLAATQSITAAIPQQTQLVAQSQSLIPIPTTVALQSSKTDMLPQTKPVLSPDKPIEIGAFSSKKDEANNKEEANIYLNFENASLASVINYLGEQKKINVVPHKDLANSKVTLTTRNPLTLTRAWDVLLTLLEMNGFSLIRVGNLYRVVLSKDNGQEPLPTYSSETGMVPEDLPDNDLVIRYVYFLKNIKVEIAKSILSRMIDEKNIFENKDLNACIIKDQSINIKSALRIIKELDSGGLREAIEVIPLQWAGADTVAALFKDILGTQDKEERIIRFTSVQQKESTYFSSSTRILPEPVKNALILLGTQKNIDKIKDFIYKYIDVPIDTAESRVHIKELRYAKAQTIGPIISQIIQPPKGTVAAEKGALVMEGGYKAFEDVLISAEQDIAADDKTKRGGGNRLIIACNREDWKRLESFIDKIDKPQPQVAIEVMIIDVTNSQNRSLGAQVRGIKGNPLARNVNVEFDNLSEPETSSETGAINLNAPLIDLAQKQYVGNEFGSYATLGYPGKVVDGKLVGDNMWALVKAVLTTENAQVVAQPYVIANNNQPCNVTVSTTFKIPGKADTKNVQTVVNWEEVTAAIKAEITPYINLSGTIDLTISMQVDQFIGGYSETPKKTQRHLQTKSTLGAGEVLVLGGLTRSDLKESLYKTPILSDIPLLGTLFKWKKKQKTETNLYIFIRPSIIKPRFEGAPDEYTQLKLDYAKYQIMVKNDTYVADKDPIQRWFFKPTHQTIKKKVADFSQGILRPIDDYTYGKSQPKSVNIQEDPYFKVSEAVQKRRLTVEERKHKQAARYAFGGGVPIASEDDEEELPIAG